MAGSKLLCALPTHYANISMKDNVHKLGTQANGRLVCSHVFFCLKYTLLTLIVHCVVCIGCMGVCRAICTALGVCILNKDC